MLERKEKKKIIWIRKKREEERRKKEKEKKKESNQTRERTKQVASGTNSKSKKGKRAEGLEKVVKEIRQSVSDRHRHNNIKQATSHRTTSFSSNPNKHEQNTAHEQHTLEVSESSAVTLLEASTEASSEWLGPLPRPSDKCCWQQEAETTPTGGMMDAGVFQDPASS